MDPNVPIAVIGMSCRFPGDVKNPEDLWQLCAEGRTGYSEIPLSKFNRDSVFHPNPEKRDASHVVGGHFLTEDIGLFDAGFFNFSAETAAASDPQFRLQLESTYEALESAGLTIQDVAGSNTSVFAGAFFKDYSDSQLRDPATLPRMLLLGVGSAMASNRISHFYDLRGASMTVDTGCSTTLTALHQACQSLRTGESDMSIVGGANVILNPDNFMIMSSISLLGKTGRSYAFDSRAEGYGRGEGSATVILKRLDDALRNGDPIRSIIRATGVNQDGKTETVTTPSQQAQEDLMRACYEKASIDPSQTLYFEAHGTGTRTGDPIEAGAIASVFKDSRSPQQPLRIGSVKTNVGHTETASGLASIIKVAMALEKGKIPPSANFEVPNEKIPLDKWNLRVPTQVENWPEETNIRRASINNFGFGGANAHVIMQDTQSFLKPYQRSALAVNGNANGHHPTANGTNGANGFHSVNRTNGVNGSNGVHNTNGTNGVNGNHATNGVNGHHDDGITSSRVIVLSAKDEQACTTMASNLKDHLVSSDALNDDAYFPSLAFTLGQRRSRFPWVSAHSAANAEELVKAIGAGRMKPSRIADSRPRIGYVYTGQGAQWFAMGRELIEAYPVFKDCLLEADGYLKELGATWSLIDELMQDEKTSRVNDTNLSTPLCVALQLALTRLLESWGVTPDAMTSHSSGEIAAACAIGALSLKATMASVFFRGAMASGMVTFVDHKGAMAAVGLGEQALQPYLARISSGQLVAACLNSPTSTTVSGDASAVEELEGILSKEQIFFRRLKVEAAWHSHHVQSIAGPYRASLAKHFTLVDGELSDIVYSSPTTGKRVASCEVISSPQHWVDSLVNPVRFIEAFRNMCFDEEGGRPELDVVIEIGPHAALSGPINEIMGTLPDFKAAPGEISYLSALVRKKDAVSTMQAVAIDLLRRGYPINMEAVNFPHGRNKDTVKVLHGLPSYPWTHKARYWNEPRSNKVLRERQDRPHDLLGSISLSSSTLAPTWRHFIRVSDLPWVRDHIVQGNMVYPGAGFLCMAIEGARQKHGEKQIQSFRLRDVNILQALVVPESADGIELQLSLRPSSTKDLSATGWEEFQVSSCTAENVWSEHCNGLIKVDVEPQGSLGHVVSSIKADDYRMRVDTRDLYASLRGAGISHGPIFQNLKNIRAKVRHSVSSFTVADVAPIMPSHYQHPHVLHPTTLDTVFQAAYTALLEAESTNTNARIPRSIKNLWVANNISKEPGHSFNAYTKLNRASVQSFEGDLAVLNDGDETSGPVMTLEGFVCQSIGNAVAQEAAAHEKERVVVPRWAPDVTLLPPEYLKQQLTRPTDVKEESIQLDLRRLCVYYFRDALAQLTEKDVAQLTPHLKKFYVWMKEQEELARLDKLAPNSSKWANSTPEDDSALIARAQEQSLNGQMVNLLGASLVPILRNEKAPLELMMQDGFLNTYYEQSLKWDRSTWQLAELTKHLVHKNPRAKVLEIGAGTGGASTSILTAIGTDDSDGGAAAASYDYTDLSSGFFATAKEKFKAWEQLIRFKKLDIEKDPVGQGFEEGTYDLIVACQVLHATKSMRNTMAHVRKLLKPGGKLLLMETTHDALDIQFAFGLLPGWWLSEEEERKSSPSLSVAMWDQVLRETGFEGVQVELPDCDSDEFYSFSCIMSTATATPPTFDSQVVLVAPDSTPKIWLSGLQDEIARVAGAIPTIQTLESASDCKGKVFIVLEELHGPILKAPSQAQFDAFKNICTTSNGVLWITQGGVLDCDNVEMSLSTGLLRTIRMEYRGKRLVSLDLDPKAQLWTPESLVPIRNVFTQTFGDSDEASSHDYEFAERNGIVSVLRLHKDRAMQASVFPDESQLQVATTEEFTQPGRPLRLTIGTPGLLDTLAWGDDPDAAGDLDADTVEIEVKAFGQNFRDVLVAMGQLDSHIWGIECSGIISRVGANAKAEGYEPGNRVMALLRGYYGNFARVHWTSVMPIPAGLSFETAASVPVVFSTAYFALVDCAKLQKGETVLIHAASGALGQAAIILAKHIGAEIYVTLGTEEKRKFIREQYSIPSDHMFSSRDTTFCDGILAKTGSRGVDVVLNSLSGLALQKSFDCVAPFGRFVEVGKRDFQLNNLLSVGAFSRAISFFAVDLAAFGEEKKHEMHRIFKQIMQLFHDKAISPVEPVTVYPISQLEKAFRTMQAGKHMGKIVLTVQPGDLVPVLPQAKRAKLRPDSSYLVVGGLGGVGRSICLWMAKRGARNIIIPSRSVKASPEGTAVAFVKEMATHGCRVKLAGCDISDAAQTAAMFDACAREMPPIRGVIQGAMVLQDSILERMTLDDWNAAVRPKVQGSWNLHTGYASQSNYSAGGTFEDALAKHRTAGGLAGVSIDLGPIKSVGYAAERDGTAERLLRDGIGVISEVEMLQTIEAAILAPASTQMVVGLHTGPGSHWEEGGSMSNDAKFAPLRYRVAKEGSRAGNVAGASNLGGRIAASASLEEATGHVLAEVTRKLMDIFMVPEAEIVPSKALSAYGVDSLVAVELRNMLALRAGAEVSIFDIMQSSSIAALAATVTLRSSHTSATLTDSL